MPKRKTIKKKISIGKKSVLLSTVGLILTLLIVAQFCYNRYVWRELQSHATFQMRTLMLEAMDGIDNLRKSPDDERRIPDVRIMLPADTKGTQDIRYIYSEPVDNMPATLEITTKELVLASRSLNGESIEELFKKVPHAQACMRGFTVYFGETKAGEYSEDTLSFVAKKRLNDGREVQIWREKNCGDQSKPNTSEYYHHELMDNLEKHLLQMQSY